MMGNPFKKYRIDYLFFGCFALLILVMLGCTIWTSYSLSSKELAKATSVHQQKLLDQLNNEIASRLTMIEQISLSTSRDNKLIYFLSKSGSEDEFTRFQTFKEVQQSLANLTYSIPLIQGIDLYMKHPFQADSYSYIQFRDLDKASEQSWYPDMRKNDFVWTGKQVIKAFQGDIAVISFVRSIEYNNRHLGYLVVHAKADSLEEMLAGSSADANRMMLDATGQPILTIGKVPDEAQWSEWKNKLTDRSGLFRVALQGERGGGLLVYSKMNQSNWTMVEVTPWSSIAKGSVRLAETIGVIGAVSIVLALLLALWLSRQLTSPIRTLVSAMNLYTLSGRKVDLPEDYRNEFGYLFAGYRKQMDRIEELYNSLEARHEQLRRAEIETLQANINPHFLYNTLDQLNWMAISAGQPEMSRILELMGRMFRIGLSNGESFITVADELEHVQCYLEIQRLRLGNGLNYKIEVAEEARKLYILKMVLQPFVENAVIHGFHLQSGGTVVIRIRPEEGFLRIAVEDNGVGLRSDPDRQAKRKTGGYGIRNVRERIKAYFGHPYGVVLSNREEGGTRVLITLPLMRERPGPANPN
jgi:two-component system sensor histidine kinase YesM